MARRSRHGQGSLVSPRFASVLAALASEKRRAMLVELARGPKSSRALAEALGLSRSSVTHHLQRLCELDLVRADRKRPHPVYRLGRHASVIVGSKKAILNLSTADGSGVTMTMLVQGRGT